MISLFDKLAGLEKKCWISQHVAEHARTNQSLSGTVFWYLELSDTYCQKINFLLVGDGGNFINRIWSNYVKVI